MSRPLRSPPPGWTTRVLGIAMLLFLPAITVPGESTNTTATGAPDVLPSIRIISGNKVEVKVPDGKNITFQPGEPTGTIFFGEICNLEEVKKETDEVARKVREIHELSGPQSETQAMLTKMENDVKELGLFKS
ncbi:uncharacterized protein LOC144867003 [Branchiostoma floridae x Branchiostoma japonicum]